MNVTKDVIVDLLPVYLAGEASADTRQLVEEFLSREPEFGREIRRQMAENLATLASPSVPPQLELQSLRRTRRILARQRWLFGAAILFSLLPLSCGFIYHDGRLTDSWILVRDQPALACLLAIVAIVLWIVYGVSRRRLRTLL